MRQPIFLDRDGVINVDITPYVCRFEDFQLFPYTIDALRILNEEGYDIYIISNQQGVSLGLIELGTLPRINDYLQEQCSRHGFRIKGIYYCTDIKTEADNCRKPSPAMILRAQQEHHLELYGATMVGDKWSDIECGYRAGLRTVLVYSGVTSRGEPKGWRVQPDAECETLLEAVHWVLAQEESPGG